MRPTAIRAEGFATYRTPVEIELGGVDFFSLSGPTGAGKSSLVDAMIFALYGRIPRLGGKSVAPVIAAGADRARVQLDFEVDGDSYTVARLAQRTGSGASVTEARLERVTDDTTVSLADKADAVTKSVESLLRLRFEDFIRTVVLPQGQFAKFLKSTGGDKQQLLRSILGLEIYREVRELAKMKAAVAIDRAERARSRLGVIEPADDATRASAVERRDRLLEMADVVEGRERSLQGLEGQLVRVGARSAALADGIARLESIVPPDDLDELESKAVAARGEVADLDQVLAETSAEMEELERQIRSLPSLDEIAVQGRALARINELAEILESGELDEAVAARSEAAAMLANAIAGRDQLSERLVETQVSHAAHALGERLVLGEECPVCRSLVETIPPSTVPEELDALEISHAEAVRHVESAGSALREAESQVASVETRWSEHRAETERLQADLPAGLSTDHLETVRSDLEALNSSVGQARARRETIAKSRDESQAALEELADSVRRVAKALTAAQLKVADLDPPVSESDDVMVQWKELMAWRHDKSQRLAAEKSEVVEAVAAAESAVSDARAELVADLETLGVVAEAPYALQVAAALKAAELVVSRHVEELEQIAELSAVIETETKSAAVASALAGHLRSDGFERWLTVGALERLVDGANGLMDQLSGGGYSLHSDDDGSFSIVDHRNADERRQVATLSGGETFLVSLALALSLAETLSAAGGSGLDAIILDEGFGTLDDETLDTVAAVLEELATRGLMVGVITHVKELAARAPIRFEVSRGVSGSSVEEVS